MWRTNYKWSIIFISYWIMSSFSCYDYIETYYELQISTAPSTYKDAFYVFSLVNDKSSKVEFDIIPVGEERNYKIFENSYINSFVRYGFTDCEFERFVHASLNEKYLKGRPYKNLLELQFPDAKPWENITLDIDDSGCYGQHFYIDVSKKNHVMPVKPDTLSRLVIYKDRKVTLDTVLRIEDKMYSLVVK